MQCMVLKIQLKKRKLTNFNEKKDFRNFLYHYLFLMQLWIG